MLKQDRPEKRKDFGARLAEPQVIPDRRDWLLRTFSMLTGRWMTNYRRYLV